MYALDPLRFNISDLSNIRFERHLLKNISQNCYFLQNELLIQFITSIVGSFNIGNVCSNYQLIPSENMLAISRQSDLYYLTSRHMFRQVKQCFNELALVYNVIYLMTVKQNH